MKQIILLITLTLLFQTSFSQIAKSISRAGLEAKGFEITGKLDKLPKDQLPSDSVSAYFGSLNAEDGYFVCLLFSADGSLFQRSKIIRLPEEDAYRCNRPMAFYQDSCRCIVTECQWMRGITCGEKYKVIEGELSFMESFSYDINAEVYKQAEIATQNDDPVAYCVAYSGAQYYSMDIDFRGAESLRWAHKKALELYKQKDYSGAAGLMLELDSECNLATCENLAEFIPEECEKIWADATLFYLKAEKYEACIDLSKRVLAVFDQATGVYLQYGDALYATKNDEFKSIYGKYVDLMQKAGREGSVPSRVVERLKK